MKRILALLVALLLPCCALAETYGLSVSLTADEALLAWYAGQALRSGSKSAFVSDEIIRAAIKLINGLGVNVKTQEDAASVELLLAGASLVDMTIHAQEDAAFMTSSLLPGYALKADTAGADAGAVKFSELAEATDWNAVSDSIDAAVQRWLSDIEPTVSHGEFAGDAFEGGTECTTWMLSDMDIAALFSGLATKELRDALIPMLKALELDADGILAQFDAANDRVADEDKYIYIFRLVRNAEGGFVGASLTIIADSVQVATVSFGLTEKSAKLVVGLGLPEKNYWWELSGKKSQLRNITYLSGQSREWVADKLEGFAYVCATNAPVSEYAWRASLTKSGSRYLWDGNVSVGNDAKYEYLLSSSGSWSQTTGEVSCSISLGDAPYEPLTLKISCRPVEAIQPMDAGLQVCSLSDPAQAEQGESLLNQLAVSLAARLIQNMQLDSLLELVDLLPE